MFTASFTACSQDGEFINLLREYVENDIQTDHHRAASGAEELPQLSRLLGAAMKDLDRCETNPLRLPFFVFRSSRFSKLSQCSFQTSGILPLESWGVEAVVREKHIVAWCFAQARKGVNFILN